MVKKSPSPKTQSLKLKKSKIMYCKECGQSIDDTATFCKFCGSPVKTEIIAEKINDLEAEKFVERDNSSDEEYENFNENRDSSMDEQRSVIKKHKIFFSSNEELIDTLGSGFISSLFVQKDFSKSVMFLSNKRIYQRGRLFARDNQGKIYYYLGEQSVDLREITGIKYYLDNPINRFTVILPSLLIGLVGFAFASSQSGDMKTIISIFSVAFIVFSIISLIVYGLKKGKWFVVEYAGGYIMTNCNWYKTKSIKRFMKNLALQKDKIVE